MLRLCVHTHCHGEWKCACHRLGAEALSVVWVCGASKPCRTTPALPSCFMLQASRALERPLTLPSAREAAEVDHQKAEDQQQQQPSHDQGPAGPEPASQAGSSSGKAEPALEPTGVDPEAAIQTTQEVTRRAAGDVSRAFGQTPPEVRP